MQRTGRARLWLAPRALFSFKHSGSSLVDSSSRPLVASVHSWEGTDSQQHDLNGSPDERGSSIEQPWPESSKNYARRRKDEDEGLKRGGVPLRVVHRPESSHPFSAPCFPLSSIGASAGGPWRSASRTGGQPWWLVGDGLSVDGRRFMSTLRKPDEASDELLSEPVVSTSPPTAGDSLADQAFASVADTAAAAAPIGGEVALIASQSNFLVAGLQYGIEAVHVATGLPWWASIVACTFAGRTALLPLTVMQMKNAAAMTLMRPEMEALNNEMRDRIQSGDTTAGLEMRSKMLALWKKYNVNPMKSLVAGLAQAPLFICFFLAVRRMCDHIPTFATGGPPLYPDLSAADPLCILPVLAGASMLGMVEMGFTDGVDVSQPAMKKMKNFLRVVAVVSVPLTYTLPSGVFLYWIANNAFSFVQTVGFKYLGLKKLFGIPQVAVGGGPGNSAWAAVNPSSPDAPTRPTAPQARAAPPLVLQALRAKQHKHGQKKS